MKSDDLAWIAGFLEGEGYFLTETSERGYIRVLIGVTSTDLDVLEKLQHLVPEGSICGPYTPAATSFGSKPHWKWRLGARGLVVELSEQLRPLMGERRQGQIDVLLEHHRTHPVIRNRTPSQAEHGTRTRYGRGCHCDRCHEAENKYQRDRRAIRKARAVSLPDMS